MIITFEELGINPVMFNGKTARSAYITIVDRACQYVMDNFFPYEEECDILPDVGVTTKVSFTNHRVYIKLAKPYTVH